jgi:hypothetical protein
VGVELGLSYLWKKHKLRIFENRIHRRILGPVKDDVAGGWRKFQNQELHNLYSSPNTE